MERGLGVLYGKLTGCMPARPPISHLEPTSPSDHVEVLYDFQVLPTWEYGEDPSSLKLPTYPSESVSCMLSKEQCHHELDPIRCTNRDASLIEFVVALQVPANVNRCHEEPLSG